MYKKQLIAAALLALGVLAFVFFLIYRADDNTAPITTGLSSSFDANVWVAQWTEMWNRYDLSLVDELFLEDERVTYFSSEKKELITGIEALREHHRGFGFLPGGKDQDNRLWVEKLRTTVYGSTALVTGTWFFQTGTENEEEVQRGPVTFLYIRIGNEYRIAHAHFADEVDA